MSHHLYSTMTERHGIVNVVMGYDPSHDHVFCTVRAEGDDRPLYTGSEDEQAGTHQLDVEYYRNIFAVLKLSVPESMFVEIQRDQRTSNGTRFLVHD